MARIGAKQISVPAGGLVIGGSNGGGTVLARGASDRILRIVDDAPEWSVNDRLTDASGLASVIADDGEVLINVARVIGTDPETNQSIFGSHTMMTFLAADTSDASFSVYSGENQLFIEADGSDTDIDIVIAPKGDGDVVIGSGTGGAISANAGEDLVISGGDGGGNLFLFHGGTGRVFYSEPFGEGQPIVLDREVATIGDITSRVADAVATSDTPQFRTELAGDVPFVLALNDVDHPTKTVIIPPSIIISINGAIIPSSMYSFNPDTQTVAFNANLPYALDADDIFIATYELAEGDPEPDEPFDPGFIG